MTFARVLGCLIVGLVAVALAPAVSGQSGLPGVPTAFQVSVSGTTVSASWAAPASGGAPTNYQLIARTTTGAPILTQNVWPTPSFIVGAVPHGVYVLSVRAQNAAGSGPETAPQTITVPSGPTSVPGAPGAPTNLQASASGNVLNVSWGAPTSGGTPTNYALIARTQAGALLATQNVWPTPAFSATVPNGVYVLSVRASNAAGAGPESAPVTVTVPSGTTPGAGAPGVPTNFQATVSGNTLSLSWGPPATGGAPTGYTLIARTTLGAVLVSQNVGNTFGFASTVPNGTYVLSVRGSNAAGPGPETTPLIRVVPEALQVPGAPRSLSATATGQSITFAWLPPASGGPAHAYVIRVSATPGGAPLASLTVAGLVTQTTVPGVPAGTYYATVIATNTAGASPASNTASVVVGGSGGSRSTLNPPGVPSSIQALTSQIYASGGAPVQMFDDYTFAGGTSFRTIAWQGIYCTAQNNAPAPSPTATAFVVSIYPDQGGRPNLAAPLASATLSPAQVNQTAGGIFVGATCNAATNTSWALFSYSVTLPQAVPAAPGVRYWLSVQAVTPTGAVVWGWRSGTNDNRIAYQAYQGTFHSTTLDRAFALTP